VHRIAYIGVCDIALIPVLEHDQYGRDSQAKHGGRIYIPKTALLCSVHNHKPPARCFHKNGEMGPVSQTRERIIQVMRYRNSFH